MTGGASDEPRTLQDAHELLRRQAPAREASLQEWHDFLRYSADVYTEIADVDRRHHHEALACAKTDREAADEMAARVAREQQAERG